MEQLNVEGIRNASQSIHNLQDSLSSCEETIGEMTKSLSAFAAGVPNIGLAAADAYVAFGTLKPVVDEFRDTIAEE